MSRDMAHVQWLQTHCQWYPMGDVRTYKSTRAQQKSPGPDGDPAPSTERGTIGPISTSLKLVGV